MNDSAQYDFDNKSNRFMEFVSREMMRRNKNKSYAEQPKQKNVLLVRETDSACRDAVSSQNSATEIYSQAQIHRYRRGASLFKNSSKSKQNSSLSKFKK